MATKHTNPQEWELVLQAMDANDNTKARSIIKQYEFDKQGPPDTYVYQAIAPNGDASPYVTMDVFTRVFDTRRATTNQRVRDNRVAKRGKLNGHRIRRKDIDWEHYDNEKELIAWAEAHYIPPKNTVDHSKDTLYMYAMVIDGLVTDHYLPKEVYMKVFDLHQNQLTYYAKKGTTYKPAGVGFKRKKFPISVVDKMKEMAPVLIEELERWHDKRRNTAGTLS